MGSDRLVNDDTVSKERQALDLVKVMKEEKRE
jgi:hypothetical protein